jgi:hypothetical protein
MISSRNQGFSREVNGAQYVGFSSNNLNYTGCGNWPAAGN